MGCVGVAGSVLIDIVIVMYLVACGSVPGSSLLGIIALDSVLVFGTTVGSCLLDVDVACECSSGGGVITSCLVACSGVPNSCFVVDVMLDSCLLDGDMVSSCSLGVNVGRRSPLGGWLVGLCLVAFCDVMTSCLLDDVTLTSVFVYGFMIAFRLLGANVCWQNLSGGRVFGSCLITCCGELYLCLEDAIALDSVLISCTMIGSCLLGASVTCESSPGGMVGDSLDDGVAVVEGLENGATVEGLEGGYTAGSGLFNADTAGISL